MPDLAATRIPVFKSLVLLDKEKRGLMQALKADALPPGLQADLLGIGITDVYTSAHLFLKFCGCHVFQSRLLEKRKNGLSGGGVE